MTLFVIRHASAGTRDPSAADDHLRELDAAGLERARLIAQRVAPHRPTRILTSPVLRCRQTVEPLSGAVGVTVEENDALAEGAPVTEALGLVASLAAAGETAALCSHGDVIPEIIRTLERTGMVIQGRRGWAKGAMWSLEVERGEIVSATYEPFSNAGLLG